MCSLNHPVSFKWKDKKQWEKLGRFPVLESKKPKVNATTGNSAGRGGRGWGTWKVPPGTPPWPSGGMFFVSPYLVSQQSRNTCFWGVANGGQVVASFEGQDDAASGQAHQLLRQVPEACEGKEEMWEKGRGCRWNQAPGKGSKRYKKELHHIKKPQGIRADLNA